MNVQVENLQPIVDSNHRQWISKYLKNFEKVQLIAFEQANPACLAPLSTKKVTQAFVKSLCVLFHNCVAIWS